MEPLQDESAFAWIRKVRDRIFLEKPQPNPNSPGIFVADLIPPKFESYARILHRFDACYDDIDNPLSPSEQTVLQIPDCEPLKSFIINHRSTSTTSRIRYRELAALAGVPFVPEINFMWFRQRMTSWCVSRLVKFTNAWPAGEECDELCAILSRFTASEECFFRLPSYFVYSGKGQPMLYTGALTEVTAFLKARPRTGFEYWWPADHQWCFCSDSDVQTTIIGGPKDLISTLLVNPVLECIEATPATRVGGAVPIPN